MSSYSIILVDDHVILREGIKRIIEEAETMRVIGEASDGLELLKLLILVFTVIGLYLRGPYWNFYWPWEVWPDIPARI